MLRLTTLAACAAFVAASMQPAAVVGMSGVHRAGLDNIKALSEW